MTEGATKRRRPPNPQRKYLYAGPRNPWTAPPCSPCECPVSNNGDALDVAQVIPIGAQVRSASQLFTHVHLSQGRRSGVSLAPQAGREPETLLHCVAAHRSISILSPTVHVTGRQRRVPGAARPAAAASVRARTGARRTVAQEGYLARRGASSAEAHDGSPAVARAILGGGGNGGQGIEDPAPQT